MQNTGQTLVLWGRFLAFSGLHAAFADLRGALCSKTGGMVAVWGRSGGGPMNEEGRMQNVE